MRPNLDWLSAAPVPVAAVAVADDVVMTPGVCDRAEEARTHAPRDQGEKWEGAVTRGENRRGQRTWS